MFGYDLSVITISPDGRVFQVEYAQKAVDLSGTSVAFQCKDAILFASEKFRQNNRLVRGSNSRIHQIDDKIALCTTGLGPDGRAIALRAKEEVTQYRDVYGVTIPGCLLADRIGLYMHSHTVQWNKRPFGVSVLLGVQDKDGETCPQLYSIDPAGFCYRYRGMSFGVGRQIAKVELEKLDLSQLTSEDALKELMRIMVLAHQETRDRKVEIEIGQIAAKNDYLYEKVSDDIVIQLRAEIEQKIEEEAMKSSSEEG